MELNLPLNNEEPSVLVYARSHGLCSVYTREEFLPVPRAKLDQESWTSYPSDHALANAATALTSERLGVNTEAAGLLWEILHFGEGCVPTCDDAWKRMRALKVECPVLQTDAELDLLRFGKREEPVLGRLRIPSEKVDVERDEGFEWPSLYSEYPSQWDKRARSEKLLMSKEVMRTLQDMAESPFSSEEWERCKDDALRVVATPVSVPRCLTPPLLPLSPPLTPYIPSSPVSRIELVPESSDPISAEANALHEQIMATDTLERTASDSSDSMLFEIINPPSFNPLEETRMMPILKRRAEDLKVDGPLTPPILSDSPLKKLKSVSFSDMLHEYSPKTPWKGEDSDDEIGSQVSLDDFFDDIEPLVHDLERKIESERLVLADTTARPKIPNMDFSLPIAPWDEYGRKKNGKHRAGETELSAQAMFLRYVKNNDLRAACKWPGLHTTEMKLTWSIFAMTHTPKVTLEETLHGEAELNKIVAESTAGSIATSETLVWKKEGLRILDDYDEEEELEPAEVRECQELDVDDWVRKRKLEMDEQDAERLPKRLEAYGSFQNSMLGGAVPQAPTSQHKPRQVSKEANSELLFGGFSATTALHKFMETRGRKVQTTATKEGKPSAELSSAVLVHKVQVQPEESFIEQAAATQHSAAGSRINKGADAQTSHPVQSLPPVPNNAPSCSFIVTLRLLQQRTMIRKVEQLYPAAELVYRDYNLPHSAAPEADIILSPSTGLIFTTLQQLKQRALPGQPDRSPLKERMRTLSQRYERLIVMASQALRGEIEEQAFNRPEDPRDKESLALFEGFAKKLEGEVIVKYIRGGEQALVHSTIIDMARYGLPHGSGDIGDIKPLAAESNELFLRRAGFNPFAAQAVLASLKTPYDTSISQTSSSPFNSMSEQMAPVSGLPAFILMAAEQRVDRFQVLMGGRRILQRISQLLDREWVSAAHGFRM